MAGNHENGTARKAQHTSRRTFIRTASLTVTVGMVGTAATGGAVGAEDTVNLGEQGLRNDDLIDPYLETYFTDGTEVRVPAGEYDYTGGGLGGNKANCALVGSPEGVTFTRPADAAAEIGPSITATGGTVRIENIAIRDERSVAQSQWRISAAADAATEVFDVRVLTGTDSAGSDTSTGGPVSLPNRIEVDGTGDAEASASYAFSVTGDLTLDEGRTTVGSGEELWLAGDIDEGYVSGCLHGGADAFFYSGQLERIELDGDADINVFQG